MAVWRISGSFRRAVAGRGTLVAVRLPLLLALALAGCATGDVLQPSAAPAPAAVPLRATLGCPCEAPPAPKSDDETSKNGDKKDDNKSDAAPKRHGPRTVPEAVCAYLRCLCSPDHKRDEEREKEKAKEKNGNGKEKDKNGNGKEKGKNGSGKEKEKNGSGATKKDEDGPRDKSSGTSQAEEQGGTPQGEERSFRLFPERNGRDQQGKKSVPEEEPAGASGKEPEDAWYSAHFQTTVVTQMHNRFNSPYQGPLSLQPAEGDATSLTSTLYLAMRLWQGGELIFNPELAGGRGLSGSNGVADFPNGEITRVGVPQPTPYFARFHLRQVFGLGDEMENVEDGVNEISGQRSVHRLTLHVGKLAASDYVDDNEYSHDPRTQFLPWALVYNGAWDYPANVRGYTYGVVLDYHTKWYTITYGIFAEPSVANGSALDPHFLNANGQVLEWEQRYKLKGHAGNVRLMAYLNHAHMGNYGEALAQMPVNPEVTATRAYRFKPGCGLSWDQELTKDLGVFGRLGWADGHSETWAFTPIDRLAEVGLSLKGRSWCRPNDVVGVAAVWGGLAPVHRAYLAAGGLDFNIGDGKLRYGPEEVFDTYYNYQVRKGINITLDTQAINHPAYNRDRGPVWVGTFRFHFEY